MQPCTDLLLDDQMQRRNCFIFIISIYNCISCTCIYDTGGYLLYVTRTVPSYLVTSCIQFLLNLLLSTADRDYIHYYIHRLSLYIYMSNQRDEDYDHDDFIAENVGIDKRPPRIPSW